MPRPRKRCWISTTSRCATSWKARLNRKPELLEHREIVLVRASLSREIVAQDETVCAGADAEILHAAQRDLAAAGKTNERARQCKACERDELQRFVRLENRTISERCPRSRVEKVDRNFFGLQLLQSQ